MLTSRATASRPSNGDEQHRAPQPWLAHLGAIVVLLATTFAVATCSHPPAEDEGTCININDLRCGPRRADAGAERDSDIGTHDDADTQSDAADANAIDASSCSDVPGGCRVEDGSDSFGTISIGCLCSEFIACPDYGAARSSCQPTETAVLRYPSCNLEIIRYRYDAYSPGTSYVYDATTHALVGGSYGSDSPIATCGGTKIRGRRAGTFPPAGCPLAEIQYPCRNDGGTNACGTCSPDPKLPSTFGWVSLDCACSTRRDACLDYTTVTTTCNPNAEIVRYPSCNLEVLRFGAGFDNYTMVYDATTHALVGTEFTVDSPSLPCGSGRVVGYRAGTFPPSDCAEAGRRRCLDPPVRR